MAIKKLPTVIVPRLLSPSLGKKSIRPVQSFPSRRNENLWSTSRQSERELIIDLGMQKMAPASRQESHFVSVVLGQKSPCSPHENEWYEFWTEWKVAHEKALADKVGFPCIACRVEIPAARIANETRPVRCIRCQEKHEESAGYVRKEIDRTISGSREESKRMPGGLYALKPRRANKK